MKKIILIALILISARAGFAQTDDLRQDLDNLFGQLDKSKVSSGYLAPYGLDAVIKEGFSGTLNDSNIVNSLDLFRFVYTDIYTAKFRPAAPSLPSVDALNNTIANTPKNTLVLLFARYELLNEAAVQNGYLSYNSGKLYDNNNSTTQSNPTGAYISSNSSPLIPSINILQIQLPFWGCLHNLLQHT